MGRSPPTLAVQYPGARHVAAIIRKKPQTIEGASCVDVVSDVQHSRQAQGGFKHCDRLGIECQVHIDCTDDAAQAQFDRNHDRTRNSLWMSTRESKEEPFGSPVNLDYLPFPSVNAGLSPDGLSVFYSVLHESGGTDIVVSTRTSRDEPFGEPVALGPLVNTQPAWEADPDVSADGQSLYFVRTHTDRGIPDLLVNADIVEVKFVPEPATMSLTFVGLFVPLIARSRS